MRYIDSIDVNTRISELLDNLDANIRTIGNDVGWHQHLGARKIGIVASAIGLLMHKKLGTAFAKEENVIAGLADKQKSDGGWPYISNSQNCSNVEATCWALLALHAYNENRQYDEIISRGTKWLLDQNPSRKDDLGWPFRENGEARVYITCFVLRTLSALNVKDDENVEAAIHWLINIQNKNGGWGEVLGDEPGVFFTSYVLLTLSELEDKIQCSFKECIENGKKWLMSSMKDLSLETSLLSCRLEMIETENQDNKYRISFFHYVLPYVVLCYDKLGMHDKVLFDSIKLLMDRSNGGIVEHPMLDSSKKRPIWALYGVFLALSSVVSGDKSDKLIFVFLNHIYRIPSCWFTRCLMKIANRWVLSAIIIALIIFWGGSVAVKIWNILYDYFADQVSPNWATFCMSVMTSIIATVIINRAVKFKKKILNLFYK